jgi:hypothetical protein
MASLDMPFLRLYRNKTKETGSLRTDDIHGAKPRRAVRDRDPEAFEKMSQLKKLQQSDNNDGLEPVRKGNKNLDHYHRLMSNLPGGLEKWEGLYNSPQKGSQGMRDALTHYETPAAMPSPMKRDVQHVKAPFYRDERSSPPSLGNFQGRDGGPSQKENPSFGASRFAAENSLTGLDGKNSKPFGQSGVEGIQPERLPNLPHPTRFRSPQPARLRDQSHDMSALMAHQYAFVTV